MLGEPRFSAVNCTVPVVLPDGMKTLAADREALVGSLLVRLTVTPFAGAACDSVTVTGVTCVIWMLVLLTESVIEPGACTVTLDVASAYPGALALMIEEPGATPVILKVMMLLPTPTGTLTGTVTTPGLLEVMVKFVLPGAGLESDNVSVPSVAAASVRLGGVRVALTPTVICDVAGAKPGAVAVIVAVPTARPLMFGCRVGCVWPWLKLTLENDNAAFAGSLLTSWTVRDDCAGAAKLTENVPILPGAIVN